MNRQNAYKPIVDMIHSANDYIQYPRIKLRNDFCLQMAGANSRYPKSINITDGKPYGENKWYGRITIGGNLQLSGKSVEPVAEQLESELDLFQQDPAKYAKGYGDLHSNCMFCRKELSNPQSVVVGYGPTCAENYGLPWGEIDPEEAAKQASLEFDLPEGTMLCGKEQKEMMQQYVTAESLAIEKLRDVAITMLSDAKHEELAELIEVNPDDEYMLLVTALWENL